MKKITLLMLFAGLFLNLNAQQIQPVKKQTGEKINMAQIQQMKSAKNNDLGWVFPADDVYAISSSTGATYYSNILYPDSTVVTVTAGTAGVNYNWSMAVGQVLDPYSVVFDPAFTTPLLAAGKSYYIDSVCILGWYAKRLPATDTLILEFTHNPAATNNSFYEVYIAGTPDTMWFEAPKTHGAANQFGYYAKLTDPAKTVIKYPLTLGDTTMMYGKYITIPVGLTIPADQITGLSINYVPGTANVFGDTIKTYGTGAIETAHLSSFAFGWYSEDASPALDIFYDPFGYNLSYMTMTKTRYVQWTGGSTALMNNIMYPFTDGGFDIGWNIEEVTGINEVANTDVKVFPNPSTGIVNIELSKNTPASANFYNLLGEVVKSVKLNNTKTAVNLSGNASGIYMLRIEQGNNVITKKVILK